MGTLYCVDMMISHSGKNQGKVSSAKQNIFAQQETDNILGDLPWATSQKDSAKHRPENS